MLKIEKTTRTISFRWEQPELEYIVDDADTMQFEQIQYNKEFCKCIKEFAPDGVVIKITPSKVIIKIEDIKQNKERYIHYMKLLETLFNDFFNTELYRKYKEDTDFNFKYWKLSTENQMNDMKKVDLYLINDNLYTCIQGSYYLSRKASIIDNNKDLQSLLIVGQKIIERTNSADMIPVTSNKKEYSSVADLLNDL